MVMISAEEARGNIGKLWEAALQEPVMVESASQPIAVVLSPAEFQRLSAPRHPRQAGCGKHLLAGVDVNALLNTPIEDDFAGYLP